MKNSLILLAFTFLFISCQQDKIVDHTLLFDKYPTLAPLNQEYMQFKDEKSALNLLNSLGKIVLDKNVEVPQKKILLEAALDVARQNKLHNRSIAILYPLIRDYPDTEKSTSWMAQLANSFYDSNKNEAANVISASLLEKFPKDKDVSKLKTRLTLTGESVSDYITKLGEQIFENPDEMGLNRMSSMNYIDACQAYALSHPGEDQSAEYLYKAAEVAKSIRSSSKSLSLYDWILAKYPNHERAPTSLFIKGFILENELKNQAMAEKVYNEFLEKYPDHQLSDDVKFLVENIGKPIEEIQKIIESKQNK